MLRRMTPDTARPLPSFWRRFWPPWVLGLLGVLALAAQVFPSLQAMPRPPALAGLPMPLLLLLALASPLVLLLIGSLLGAGLAHRTDLRSWAAGTSAAPTATALRSAVLAGLGLALAFYLLDWLLQPWLDAEGQLLLTRPPGTVGQLLQGVLYGGLTEEVMVRWGLLSLLAWALHRLLRRPNARAGAGVFWAANIVAALLFAAGHLPALFATLEPSSLLLARVLLLNTLAGLVYGWLFWRHQLESAMAAHASTHVGFWLLAWLVG